MAELIKRGRPVQALLFEYIVIVKPVGSRQVAKKYALGLSPATSRNAMADLEEMGYLAQPQGAGDAGHGPLVGGFLESAKKLFGRLGER